MPEKLVFDSDAYLQFKENPKVKHLAILLVAGLLHPLDYADSVIELALEQDFTQLKRLN